MNPEKAPKKHSLPILLSILSVFVSLNVLIKVLVEQAIIDRYFMLNELVFSVLGPFSTASFYYEMWITMLMLNTPIYSSLIYCACISKDKSKYVTLCIMLWIAEGMWNYMATVGNAITWSFCKAHKIALSKASARWHSSIIAKWLLDMIHIHCIWNIWIGANKLTRSCICDVTASRGDAAFVDE